MDGDGRWWGSIALDVGGAARWRIGPSTAWAQRRAGEWRLWFDVDGAASDAEAPTAIAAPPEQAPTLTFAFAETPDTLTLAAALPDRTVVIRPTVPLRIPPWQRVSLHVTTPAFVALRVEVRGGRRGATSETRPVLLTEVATLRLADTWIGPSTREGDLAYAQASAVVAAADDLPSGAHLATTPIAIDNRSDAPLPIDRLALPMTTLSLHADARGRLRTDQVIFTRDGDGEPNPSIAPNAAPGLERLASPRDARGVLGKTFARLLRVGAA